MIPDEELCRRMAEGDQEAFEMLVTRYHGPLLSYTTHWLRDREKAQDIVQETFIRLIRQLQTGQLDYVKAWLYRVAMNLCRDYWRSAAYKLEQAGIGELPEQEDISPSAERIAEMKETGRELAASLEQLPDPQQTVIRLRFYQDMKLQEIADLLEIPLSTIKSYLYKGLKKLENVLNRSKEDPGCPKTLRTSIPSNSSKLKESEARIHESSIR
ncbi:RNA polymerase sigma factor [Paenibacillus tuaregi]|uniref:RNA polymerase sigma factor n=1 Tax=Paenibacillus tuaregi TaxID=1816681 RepID=UPI00083815C6|nr:RNA polymerase sigma factor [Paenibacillus tuaregi]